MGVSCNSRFIHRMVQLYKPDWKVYNEIPKDAYEYDIYSNIAVAKKYFQSDCNNFLQKKMYSRAAVIFFLKEHQILNWIGKKELKDNPYLREEDFVDILVKIKEKREKKKLLHYYPFAEIGKLLVTSHKRWKLL